MISAAAADPGRLWMREHYDWIKGCVRYVGPKGVLYDVYNIWMMCIGVEEGQTRHLTKGVGDKR